MYDDNEVGQEHYDAVTHQAASVLGQTTINEMSPPQINLLNQWLGRIVMRRRTSAAITDMEIIGAYEMIEEHAYPNGRYELFNRKERNAENG